jgi:pimeloyl-ACP methyl ester carboxylesterase
LKPNPDALRTAEPPRVGRYAVNGTTLYAEVRGSGPPVLLIPAGGEDAEWWRPVAERLRGRTVVTYDRRGSPRSGREDWPGKGSVQHADDAAGLLAELGLHDAVVFGNSSAGVVALQLAIRHPDVIRRALVFEPGYLRQVSGGDELHRRMREAAAEHLSANPADWPGAAAAVGRALAPAPAPGSAGLFTPPEGKEWYWERGSANAEPLLRDDVPILSHEIADEAALAVAEVDIRFAYGSRTAPIFREIATHLASVRGNTPDVIEGVSHSIHYQPDVAATYISEAGG